MFWRIWELELWALFGCTASFTCLVVLAAVFDGRSVFQWNGITLNAIISILSVAIKVFLVFAVEECIGQWNWIAFSRVSRELADFERIDLASRGPLGGIYLIGRKHTPWVLRLGIGVIILTIALDPVSQQLVQLEPGIKFVKDINDEVATSPRAHDYTLGTTFLLNKTNSTESPDGPAVGFVGTRLDISMEAAILNAFSRDITASDLRGRVDVRCPTSNCTWTKFFTLGVCHRCSDQTSELRRVDNVGEVINSLTPEVQAADSARNASEKYDYFAKENASAHALPNGHFLPNVNGCYALDVSDRCDTDDKDRVHIDVPGYSMTTFGTGNAALTNTMGDIDTLIWSSSVIFSDKKNMQKSFDERLGYSSDNDYAYLYWPNSAVGARECALYYCVKSVESSVQGNKAEEHIAKSTDYAKSPNSWEPEYHDDEMDRFYSPENMPDDRSELLSLEFDPSYSNVKMTDLSFHSQGQPSYPMINITQKAVESISAFFQQSLRDTQLSSPERLKVAADLFGEDAVGLNGLVSGNNDLPSRIGGLWGENEGADFEAAFEKLAVSMTNDLRTSGGDGSHDSTRQTPDEVGRVGISTTLYRTYWYWIVLHGLLLVGGCVFCPVTMAISARGRDPVPAWKSSALAAMSQVPAASRVLDGVTTTKGMWKKAGETSLAIPDASTAEEKGKDSGSSECVRLESDMS